MLSEKEWEQAVAQQVTDLRAALQWLLDDMESAGEIYALPGVLYDSVEHAGRVLKACGGSPPFNLPEKREEGQERNAQ